MIKEREFPTIRQFCKKYPELFGEHTLRLMEKQGALPGLRIGNRYLINERAFLEQLSHSDMGNSQQEAAQ